ncbi:secondary thiamine-phosphate synthase enzyme YjbQ [soil metagenome]
MKTEVLELHTGREPAVIDITTEVVRFCDDTGDGLLSIFVPHATAGLALIEVGSGTEKDLLATLRRLLTETEPWLHQHGSPGHGADHVLPALLSPTLTIPVVDGRPALGRWQSIVVVDLNRDNLNRQVRLSFLSA